MPVFSYICVLGDWLKMQIVCLFKFHEFSRKFHCIGLLADSEMMDRFASYRKLH
jgi:hypothetical protein